MTTGEFISAFEILQIVTGNLDDQDYSSGLSRGWYLDRIHDATKELNRKTKIFRQPYDAPIPEDLRLPVPKDTHAILDVMLYNGECCESTLFEPVHWKMNMSNQRTGANGYQGSIMEGSGFSSNVTRPQLTSSRRVYFCDIFDGHVELSPSCKSFDNIRLWYVSSARYSDDLPVIPEMYKEAIENYVDEYYYRKQRAIDPNKYNRLFLQSKELRESSFDKVAMNFNVMDPFKRKRMREYLTHYMAK
jgi:hypothetical protein